MTMIMTEAKTASTFASLEPDDDEIPVAFEGSPVADIAVPAHQLDVARLQGVLQDLIACRQLLDRALKDG